MIVLDAAAKALNTMYAPRRCMLTYPAHPIRLRRPHPITHTATTLRYATPRHGCIYELAGWSTAMATLATRSTRSLSAQPPTSTLLMVLAGAPLVAGTCISASCLL